jgi:hypothetical protein
MVIKVRPTTVLPIAWFSHTSSPAGQEVPSPAREKHVAFAQGS